jgi:hypothetical protein
MIGSLLFAERWNTTTEPATERPAYYLFRIAEYDSRKHVTGYRNAGNTEEVKLHPEGFPGWVQLPLFTGLPLRSGYLMGSSPR